MALTPLQIEEERKRLLEAQQQAANAAAGIPAGIAVNGNAYSQGTYRPPAPPSLANVPAAPPPRTDLSSGNSLASVPPPPEAQTAANGALRAQRLEKAAARGGLVGQAARTELEKMGVTKSGANSYSQAPGARTAQATDAFRPSSLAAAAPQTAAGSGIVGGKPIGFDTSKAAQNAADAARFSAPAATRQNPVAASLEQSRMLTPATPEQMLAAAQQRIDTNQPISERPANLAQAGPATGGGGSQPQTDATAAAAPTLANPTATVTQVEDAAVLPTVPEAAAQPQTALEKAGIQKTVDKETGVTTYTAAPGGTLAAAGEGPGVSEIGGSDRTAAIQSLADTMKRDRLQTSERRQAERLRDDASAAGRYARFYGDQAVSSGIDGPRINANLANQAAGWSAEQQRLQQQIAAQEQQGPLTSNQLQANAELEQARGQVAAQQTQAAAQQTAAGAQLIEATRAAQRPVLTKFQEVDQEAQVKSYRALQDQAKTAQTTLQQLNRAAGLSDEVAGRFATPLAYADSVLSAFGITEGNYAEKVQQLEGLSNELALKNKDALGVTGVLSDTDIKLLQSTTVKSTNEKGANLAIIHAQAELSKRLIDEAAAQKAWVEGEGRGTLDGYQSTLNVDESLANLEVAANPELKTRISAAQQKNQNITPENLRHTAKLESERQGKEVSMDDVLKQMGF